MISFGARLFKLLLRIYTYPYRKKHMSLSRSVRVKSDRYVSPKGTAFSVRAYGGVRTEIFVPDNARRDRLIVMFHGGGHTRGMNDMYRKAAASYATATGCEVRAIDYTPGADLVYPSVHDECLRAYDAIADDAADKADKKIVCIGDSFGVGLMLYTCLKRRDVAKPLPSALVSVSAYVDLAASGESYRKNCYSDPMYSLPRGMKFRDNEHFIRRRTPYAAGTDEKDPYLSPAYADFTGMPRMLVICGDCETSESDSDMLHSAARRAGTDVTLRKYRGMFHDFMYIAPRLKESKRAISEIAGFILDSGSGGAGRR